MKTYYHGTTERNARAIEAEGFLGSDAKDFTDGFSHDDNGVIFLAVTPEHAAGYGEAIIAVETEEAVFFGECPVTGLPEYAIAVTGEYNFWRI